MAGGQTRDLPASDAILLRVTTVPRLTALPMLRSTMKTVSAPAGREPASRTTKHLERQVARVPLGDRAWAQTGRNHVQSRHGAGIDFYALT
jgi:hypothetical protein